MADDLYESDALAWAEQQAALLRRLAAGERVNDAVDWPHVIEEVQDLGLAQLHAVQSLLRRALEHLLKAHGWPQGPVDHWLAEIDTFLGDASDAYSPSMARRIDLNLLYQRSRIAVGRQRHRGQPPGPLPETCPFRLHDLIMPGVEPPDVRALYHALQAAESPFLP